MEIIRDDQSECLMLYAFLECLSQKALSLLMPSSRAEGSIANVTRSQFLSPTAIPEEEGRKFRQCGLVLYVKDKFNKHLEK